MAKKKLITHNGSFHADDLFAAATLALMLEQKGQRYEIIRTRAPEVLVKGDYVFDVGGIYDPETNRFDHHQKGGAGARENGIPYSAFGLVWKHFGLNLVEGNQELFEKIDKETVIPFDAIDNGIDIVESKLGNIFPLSTGEVFLVHSPTWKEEKISIDKVFIAQVEEAKKFLQRKIKVLQDDLEGTQLILEAYKNTSDKRTIELPRSLPRYLYQKVLSSLPEPIYLIYKSEHVKEWKIEAISKSPETFESRKPFPKAWCGFVDYDPKASVVIGVPGIQFTHNGGFLAGTSSRESAYKLAELALKS